MSNHFSEANEIDKFAHNLADQLRGGDFYKMKGVAMELQEGLQFLHSNDACLHLINEINKDLGGNAASSSLHIEVKPPQGSEPVRNVFIVNGNEEVAAGKIPSQ